MPSDGNPICLRLVLDLEDISLEDTSSEDALLEDASLEVSCTLRYEDDAMFVPEWLRLMLQMDIHTYSTMEPTTYMIGFDDFISRYMWPGHEQQPKKEFTPAQVCCLNQIDSNLLTKHRKSHFRRRDFLRIRYTLGQLQPHRDKYRKSRAAYREVDLYCTSAPIHLPLISALPGPGTQLASSCYPRTQQSLLRSSDSRTYV